MNALLGLGFPFVWVMIWFHERANLFRLCAVLIFRLDLSVWQTVTDVYFAKYERAESLQTHNAIFSLCDINFFYIGVQS